jgi:hypothetical protein
LDAGQSPWVSPSACWTGRSKYRRTWSRAPARCHAADESRRLRADRTPRRRRGSCWRCALTTGAKVRRSEPMSRSTMRGCLLAVSALVTCGGHASPASSSANSSGPNLDTSRRLADLSSADWQELCDWAAQEEGGYGNAIACDAGSSGGSLAVPNDEPSCVAEYSVGANCPATVQQLVSCLQLLTRTWCDTATLPAECKALKATC